MGQNQYEELLSNITGLISDKDALEPNMPVAEALQEAKNLFEWCQADREKLEKAGLDWSIVLDLPLRIDACRYIQSQWQNEYLSLEEAQREWALKSPVAYELRDELLHHFFHAYRNNPDLYGKVQKIAEGNTHADMIQDLSDLEAFGTAHQEPLMKINFDLSLLPKAKTMSNSMADLLAKSNGKKMENNKTKLLRDKAYTYMKQAVDEIREHGQYVFWKDDQRHKGYVSLYFKRKNNKHEKEQATKPVAKV